VPILQVVGERLLAFAPVFDNLRILQYALETQLKCLGDPPGLPHVQLATVVLAIGYGHYVQSLLLCGSLKSSKHMSVGDRR
jgi:hypothetical protein